MTIPVHPETEAHSSRPANFSFGRGEGKPKSAISDWQKTLKRLGQEAGIHVHAHRYRHTLAVELVSKGIQVSEVAAIPGNTLNVVKKHYSHWIQQRQDAINAAVKATWVR